MKKKGRFWRSLGFALLPLSLTMLLLLPPSEPCGSRRRLMCRPPLRSCSRKRMDV